MATYTTAYSVGEKVWLVRHSNFQQIIKCQPCANTGKIDIGGETFVCPKCSGRASHPTYAGVKYYIDCESRVGKVTVEDCPENHSAWESDRGKPNPRNQYMVEDTGVGSGQVWDEEDLFPTKEAAQIFCDQRNGLLPAHEVNPEDHYNTAALIR